MSEKRVIVIGGGAAGLMAAGFAAQNGAKVTVFEKMHRVGRKIMITGKGRCNLANECDVETFMQNVPVNNKFLYSAIYNFTPYDIIDFFNNLGLQTKTERGNRVYPISEKAVDVVDTMRNFALDNGAKIVNKEVKSLLIENGVLKGIKADTDYYADSVIVATGGASYPLTGSTGDGYKFAKSVGHTIIPIKPSLVPLESDDKFCKDMQGLSLRNVALTVKNEDGREIYKDFGEMLFTHFGISGPIVLSASCHMQNFDSHSYTTYIDLKPALSEEQLDLRIQKDFKENINKAVSNSFSKLLPKKMIPVVLKRWGVPFEKKCNSITKEERKNLVNLLKNFSVSISKPRPVSEAIITSGGVKVTEINPKTMESKLMPNLYFAGEVIDVDAYTGGFNLIIAWATGRLSGESAAC
ncbi:MAG: NAD(P)/FAD-dependent oxidoreductase [Oscillospiraceae bacterium]|nr:NAD(P)/FAD-dependent oxidoreductase [Oscillospiraceae bacterium]